MNEKKQTTARQYQNMAAESYRLNNSLPQTTQMPEKKPSIEEQKTQAIQKEVQNQRAHQLMMQAQAMNQQRLARQTPEQARLLAWIIENNDFMFAKDETGKKYVKHGDTPSETIQTDWGLSHKMAKLSNISEKTARVLKLKHMKAEISRRWSMKRSEINQKANARFDQERMLAIAVIEGMVGGHYMEGMNKTTQESITTLHTEGEKQGILQKGRRMLTNR